MSSSSGTRPNLMIIHTHDTGRYLGCYGYHAATPHIDRLAAEGLRFDNYFCPAPQCSPSRASALTGLYPHNNGMMGLAHLGFSLKEGVPTLPALLGQGGYEPLLFGTQHEAKDPLQLGYARTCVTKMPQRAETVAAAVASFLRERGAQDGDRPFFASVGFWETHRPFDEPVYTPDPAKEVRVPPFLPDTPEVRQDLAEFHGTVKAADEAVGAILEALEATGLAANTLVVLTTDHGIAFPRAKGTLYDAGLGIALLMRWPGQIPAGRVCSQLLCNVDLLPTLAEVAGISAPGGIDGKSFLPLLFGEATSTRDHFFCELTWHDRYSPARGIRTGKWKYIKHLAPGPSVYLPLDIHKSLSGSAVREQYYSGPHAGEELYDLEADPLETSNLAGEAVHAEMLAELRNRVRHWREATSDPLLKGPIDGTEAPGWDAERAAGTFRY